MRTKTKTKAFSIQMLKGEKFLFHYEVAIISFVIEMLLHLKKRLGFHASIFQICPSDIKLIPRRNWKICFFINYF